jgi:hypothetical protein
MFEGAFKWISFQIDQAILTVQMAAAIIMYYLSQAAGTAQLISLMFEGAFKWISFQIDQAKLTVQMAAAIIMYYLSQAAGTAQLISLVFEAAFKWIKDKVSESIDSVKTKVETGLDNIKNLWALFKLMVTLLVIQMVANVTNWFTNLINNITGKANDVKNAALSFGENILTGIKDAIGDAAAWAQTNIIDPIVNTIMGAGSSITDAIKSIIPDKINLGPLGSVDLPIPGFASGGLLRGLGIVGENGPELAVAGDNTAIIPNNRLMDMFRDSFGSRANVVEGQTAQAGRQEVYNFYGDINLPAGSMLPSSNPAQQARDFFDALKTERTRLGGGTVNA